MVAVRLKNMGWERRCEFCGEGRGCGERMAAMPFTWESLSMKRLALAGVVLVLGCVAGVAQDKPVYQDKTAPVEARITDLLGRMTMDEKLAMLGTDPTIPRLGIVGTNHVEGLHGLALGGPGGWGGRGLVTPTTQFPQSHGLGQTWDPELLRQAAAEEAYETRWAYDKYHKGGLVVRAPNADLSRDPRWGRTEESYGEDPFLVGTLATAYTEGLQGNDPKLWMTSSLLKHFLANSNEDGRAGSSSDFDNRLFYEYYSVPFRMAIEEGHANAMMTSYNSWNKVPMGANPVLHDVVMKDWGFDGIICTDAGALGNMMHASHTYNTMAEAAAAAIHAGINQFLENATPSVQEALNQGLIHENDIDKNLRGVFRVMIRLGMLEPAGSDVYAHIGFDRGEGVDDPWLWAKNKALARKVAEESIVLLKNEGHLLPLDAKQVKSIAVIGPLADKVALDWYSGTPPYTVTPVEGIRERVGATVAVQCRRTTIWRRRPRWRSRRMWRLCSLAITQRAMRVGRSVRCQATARRRSTASA